MFAFPSTGDLCIPVVMTDSSVTDAGPAVIPGDSTDVTGSFVADNTPSANVYHVVGTLYPSFDTGEVAQTSGNLEVQPAKYTESTDAMPPPLPGQLQNSLRVATALSTPIPNESLQANVVSGGGQVKFCASPQFVEQFAFPTDRDTQDFGASFSAFAPTAAAASDHVLSSDVELMDCTTPLSQTYQRTLSMPCYRNSFELFPFGVESHQNPLTCSSLVESPVTKVSVDCEGMPLNLSDLSSNFSIGCLDGVSFSSMPDLQSSTSSVCIDTCFSDRLHSGISAAAVDYGKNTSGLSNEGRRENVSRTTAVVISATKNSSSPSVVLSPSKLISALPDVPEPVLLLTQGQLKQLGLTVNILSLPTISTSKEHATCSPSKINPQQSSEDENIVKNSDSRPNGELLPCCIHGSESCVCIKDMIRFAFESEVGLPETLIDNTSVEGDVASTASFRHDETLCCNYWTGDKMTDEKDRSNEDEQQLKEIDSNYYLHFHETNNLSNLPHSSSQALIELKLSVDGTTDKSKTTVDCLSKSNSLEQDETEHTTDENVFVNRSNSDVSVVDSRKCICNHFPSPMVTSEPNEDLSMCTPTKYMAVSSSICRSRQSPVHCQRDKGICSTTSATTVISSSSPHRRVWHHASSARTSKGSFRNKAKMFGQQSPMRFILPNPNPPPSPVKTEANSVIKPSVKDVLAIPKRPKCLQAIAPKPFQARSLSLKNVSVGLTGGRKAQKGRQQAAESSSNVRLILPKPDSKAAGAQFPTELSSVQSLGKQKRRLYRRCEDLGMRNNVETSFRDQELNVESNGTEKDEAPTVDVSFDIDSQTEEENDGEQHLAELLEASTTIRYSSYSLSFISFVNAKLNTPERDLQHIFVQVNGFNEETDFK